MVGELKVTTKIVTAFSEMILPLEMPNLPGAPHSLDLTSQCLSVDILLSKSIKAFVDPYIPWEMLNSL